MDAVVPAGVVWRAVISRPSPPGHGPEGTALDHQGIQIPELLVTERPRQGAKHLKTIVFPAAAAGGVGFYQASGTSKALTPGNRRKREGWFFRALLAVP